MSVLCIETAIHLKRDIEWTWYTDNEKRIKVWEKYVSNYGDLTVVAPYEKEVCGKNSKELIKLGNDFALEKKNITLYDNINNLYENKFNMLNRKMRQEVINVIWRYIRSDEVDLIIIGKDKNFYQRQALKYAKKFKKKYEIV